MTVSIETFLPVKSGIVRLNFCTCFSVPKVENIAIKAKNYA
jgi:hypothetical protein